MNSGENISRKRQQKVSPGRVGGVANVTPPAGLMLNGSQFRRRRRQKA